MNVRFGLLAQTLELRIRKIGCNLFETVFESTPDRPTSAAMGDRRFRGGWSGLFLQQRQRRGNRRFTFENIPGT